MKHVNANPNSSKGAVSQLISSHHNMICDLTMSLHQQYAHYDLTIASVMVLVFPSGVTVIG